MRASSALIAWTPADCALTGSRPCLRRTAGSVAVIPWPDRSGRVEAYAKVAGACDEAWRSSSSEALATSIFVIFNAMVLRDGVNPLTAHVSLLELDEYRCAVAADLRLPQAVPVRNAAVVNLADYASRGRG